MCPVEETRLCVSVVGIQDDTLAGWSLAVCPLTFSVLLPCVSGGSSVPFCGQEHPRAESTGRPACDHPRSPRQEGEPRMELGGSKWTEGICAFQLSGQDLEPNSLGLESSLLACPLWNPHS